MYCLHQRRSIHVNQHIVHVILLYSRELALTVKTEVFEQNFTGCLSEDLTTMLFKR